MTQTVSVKDVLFSQSSIKNVFNDGHTLKETTAALKNGDLTFGDGDGQLKPIRVVEVDGKLVSLDNRRLFVAKEALKGKRQQLVKVVVVQLDDLSGNQAKHPGRTVLDELYGENCKPGKMTSVKPEAIRIKDGLATFVPREGRKGGLFVYDQNEVKVYASQLSDKKLDAIAKLGPAGAAAAQDLRDIKARQQAEKKAGPWP